MTQRILTMRRPAAGRLGRLTALALLPFAVAACGDGIRESFGLDRRSPDEFMVTSRAPLSMPPEFALRPPQPGVPRPQEGTTRQRAQQAVFGMAEEPATAADFEASGLSTGASTLLANAGATRVDPGIRQVVDQESTELAIADDNFIDRLMFWQDQPPSGLVVDAEAERARLAAAAATGQPLNQGEVPTIERRRRAPLEGIFDGLFD